MERLNIQCGAAIAAALLLQGCQSTDSFQVTPDTTYHATKMTVSSRNDANCIFLDNQKTHSSPILAADFAAALLKEGISLVGAALTAAGSQKSTVGEMAFANYRVRKDNPPICVQIVRGEFYRNKPDSVKQPPEWTRQVGISETQWASLVNVGLYPSKPPELLFEGYIKPVKNNIFVLAPTYIGYRASLDSDGLTFDSKRALSISIDFFSPTSPDKKPIGSTLLVLGEIKRGQAICYGTYTKGICSLDETGEQPQDDPFALSTPTAPKAETIVPPLITAPSSSIPFVLNLPEDTNDTLYYAQGAVTETRGANEFIGFIGKVFSSVQPKLTTAADSIAQHALSEDARVAERVRITSEKAISMGDYVDAIVDAVAALTACKQGDTQSPTYLSLMRDTIKRQQAANLKAIDSGQAVPFQTSSILDIRGSRTEAQKKCATELDAITR